MMRKHEFTLIELLVSIGIIVILAAILVPAVLGAVKKGEIAKCRAEMTTLVNAIKQYEGNYNKLPKPTGYVVTSGLIYVTTTDHEKEFSEDLINALQGDDAILVQGSTTKKVNPRKIKFLEKRESAGEYPDPWDGTYKIIMSEDEEISLNGNVEGFSAGTVYQSVVIWSAGPDGVWGTKDDVHSFPSEYEGGTWTVTN